MLMRRCGRCVLSWSPSSTTTTARRHAPCRGCRPRGLRVSASSQQGAPGRSAAANAAILTGCYATVAGLALTLAPAQAFGLLFNPSEVPRGWIRVGGILFALIGLQYLGAGLGDAPQQGQGPGAVSFYKATVWSRLLLATGFSVVVALGEAPLTLLVLAAINVLGALSMMLAIQRGR